MEYTEYLECFCKYVKNFMANISRFYSNQVEYPYPTYSNQAPNTTSKRGNESGLLPVGKIRVRDGKWFYLFPLVFTTIDFLSYVTIELKCKTYEPLEMRKHKGYWGTYWLIWMLAWNLGLPATENPIGMEHHTQQIVGYNLQQQQQGTKHYNNKTKDTIYNNKKYGEAPQQRKYDTFYKLSLLFFLLHRLPSSGRRAKFISGSLA